MNALIEFVEKGGSFLSEEGKKIIQESRRSTIKEALQNPETAKLILIAANQSFDPHFRRNIFLAFSD